MALPRCRNVLDQWEKYELKDLSLSELCALFVNCDKKWKCEGKRKGKNTKLLERTKRRINAELKRRRIQRERIYYDYAYHAF